MWSAHKEREPVPVTCNGRMHGGMSPGAPKGNRNAVKHGFYSAEAIARRREIATMLRAMHALARATGKGD
jgi:uncharacterized protein YjcR